MSDIINNLKAEMESGLDMEEDMNIIHFYGFK